MENPILTVNDLSVGFATGKNIVPAVRNATFELHKSEILGIVGESGSGKSTLANAVIRLLKGNGAASGEVIYDGTNLLELPEKKMQAIRGREIGMVFQDPIQGLDPTMTVGALLREALHVHRPELRGKELIETSETILSNVGFAEPKRVLKNYPFEMSGGMNQRILIAMALVPSPRILICDEPTTALDVTIQEQIIGLMKRERKEHNLSMLFITHNFGIAAEICDRLCVMYGGKIVEIGTCRQIFDSPAHPYTQALLETVPVFGREDREYLPTIPGTPYNAENMTEGCPFAPRCSCACDACRAEFPQKTTLEQDHIVFCNKFSKQ